MKTFSHHNIVVGICILALTVFVTLLAGCEVQTWMGYNQTGKGGTQESGNSKPEDSGAPDKADDTDNTSGKVSFELPSEWEWSPDYPTKARLNERPKDSGAPYVVLVLYVWQKGSDEDAKTIALEHLKEQQENNPENPPTFKELELDGVNLYLVELHTDSYWGDFWWSTQIFFVKDGHVFSIDVDDRYENKQEAIKMAIETLKLN